MSRARSSTRSGRQHVVESMVYYTMVESANRRRFSPFHRKRHDARNKERRHLDGRPARFAIIFNFSII